MGKVLEQKFFDALEAIERLRRVEEEFGPRDVHLPVPCPVKVTGKRQEFLISELEDSRLSIKPYDYGWKRHTYDARDLTERVRRLIGDNTVVYVEIGDLPVKREREQDVKSYVAIDGLLDKPVSRGYSVLPHGRKTIVLWYNSDGISAHGPELRVVRIDTSESYDPRLIDLLRNKSRTVHRDGGALIFELYAGLQSLADFVNLTEESAGIVQLDRHMVTGFRMHTPIQDLNMLRQPFHFVMKFDDGFVGLDYVYDATRREGLELRIPRRQLAQAAEFYDGLRV